MAISLFRVHWLFLHKYYGLQGKMHEDAQKEVSCSLELAMLEKKVFLLYTMLLLYMAKMFWKVLSPVVI